MTVGGFTTMRIGQSLPRREFPDLSASDFRRTITNAVGGGQHVAAFFGHVSNTHGNVELYAVLSDAQHAVLRIGKMTLDSDQFPSITPDCPQVHLFEREIAEQYGVRPTGHPWFKPVRFHSSYRPGHDAWNRKPDETPVIGVMDYYRVEGDEIHEVAVGPVHAGVIEPGHFRFQCHGEQVFHLEISLGYQHRGAERTLVGGPDKRTLHTLETVAGDTSIGHATAYCQAVEALAGCRVPLRAEVLRGIVLELERLANHAGDLGALAGDVGFLPTASYCGRLRGDFLNLTALLCGSRFGRGMLRPGGVRFDLDESRKQQCLTRLESAYRDVENAANLLWNSASVQARFEGTGSVHEDAALRWGWSARRRGPAVSSVTSARTFRRAFIASHRFRSLPGRRETSSLARMYAGSKSRDRSRSFTTSSRDFPTGRLTSNAERSSPSRLSSRWSKGGAGKSATWRSLTSKVVLRVTRSSTRRSTTGRGWPSRFATSRSRTSLFATRVSICLTAVTTCKKCRCWFWTVRR